MVDLFHQREITDDIDRPIVALPPRSAPDYEAGRRAELNCRADQRWIK
jgi:hypothetical protein